MVKNLPKNVVGTQYFALGIWISELEETVLLYVRRHPNHLEAPFGDAGSRRKMLRLYKGKSSDCRLLDHHPNLIHYR
jgi:hypothetical protein